MTIVSADLTPGERLARALTETPEAAEVTVELPVSLPTTFPFFAERPRYTVRHLLEALPVPESGTVFVHEPPAVDAPELSGTQYASSPEASFVPRLERGGLTELRARVPLPEGLTAHPELLARYVDRRVTVRLCTIENQVLLHGSDDGVITGLLRVPGRRGARGPLAAAAALVEETGGSCDGMVVHPDVYWTLVADGLLDRLTAVGVRVSRTRMIDRGQALLGDFRAAATLLDPARSRVRLLPGPGGTAVECSALVGLAVHLPQHLLLLELD
ncbi:MAG: family 3 encapsulin nanocompartment shell protein [Actinomadura sp.]